MQHVSGLERRRARVRRCNGGAPISSSISSAAGWHAP
jgi:hypothetical protein